MRYEALSALIRNDRDNNKDRQLDDATHELIDKALQHQEPWFVTGILSHLVYSTIPSGGMGGGGGLGGTEMKLLHQPKDLPALLFHKDEDVRRKARGLLPYLDESDAIDLAAEIILVLKDESRPDDHIEAIRALGALQRQSRQGFEGRSHQCSSRS